MTRGINHAHYKTNKIYIELKNPSWHIAMTMDSLQSKMWPDDGVRYGRSRNSSHSGLEASLQGKIFLYLSALKNLSADPIMDPSTVTCTMLFLLNKIGFLIPGLELSYLAQQQNSQHY
jgi:hypothetical protein